MAEEEVKETEVMSIGKKRLERASRYIDIATKVALSGSRAIRAFSKTIPNPFEALWAPTAPL